MTQPMSVSVILPAAGRGSRFAAGGSASASKIEYELQHKPVFLHAVEAFRQHPDVTQIILAVAPDRLDDFRFRFDARLSDLGVTLIAGGTAERWETVKLALDAVDDSATHIAVHDAARPCVSPQLIERVFAAAASLPAVLPGLPVSDTLKKVGEAGDAEAADVDPIDAILGSETSPTAGARPIQRTVDRASLYAVQTPQVFEAGLLRRAYKQAGDQPDVTDDASLLEALGETVHVIEGDPLNLKITRPADAELLEAVLTLRHAQHTRHDAVRELFGDDDDD